MPKMPRPERLGDGPIDLDLVQVMKDLAAAVDEILNGGQPHKKNGFCLMVFPFQGFDGRCNYISNAQRKDVITLLKEQIARFEGQPEIRGQA
jgi:hypothetical protein